MIDEDALLWYDRDGRPMDLLTWAQWMRASGGDRHVGLTVVGNTEVSTVFLGVDHSGGLGPRPVLYETMLFGPGREPEDEMARYCTEEQARAGHAVFVNTEWRRYWRAWRPFLLALVLTTVAGLAAAIALA